MLQEIRNRLQPKERIYYLTIIDPETKEERSVPTKVEESYRIGDRNYRYVGLEVPLSNDEKMIYYCIVPKNEIVNKL